MADRFSRMPHTPEVHVFQAEIGGGEQIVVGWKAQNGTVIANSRHHSAIFWRWQVKVTVTLSAARMDGIFDLFDQRFF